MGKRGSSQPGDSFDNSEFVIRTASSAANRLIDLMSKNERQEVDSAIINEEISAFFNLAGLFLTLNLPEESMKSVDLSISRVEHAIAKFVNKNRSASRKTKVRVTHLSATSDVSSGNTQRGQLVTKDAHSSSTSSKQTLKEIASESVRPSEKRIRALLLRRMMLGSEALKSSSINR